MRGRNKTLFIFGLVYIIFALIMFFGLKTHLRKDFSTGRLTEMISGKSIYRDTTTDLCKYQILGDPKEISNYVKVNIFCKDGKKASSTLTLSAIEDKTVDSFIREYARIIGFDEKLINNNFVCSLDGLILTDVMRKNIIRPTSSLNCTQKS
jgi:hypothetical protein